MQDLSRSYILLNGEPKTLQIESIVRINSNLFSVRFNNNKTYSYSADKVLWLNDYKWFDPLMTKVYLDGILQKGIGDIWCFEYKDRLFWRIKYCNGFVADFTNDQIDVVRNSLDGKTAKDTFEYMRSVATINPLGKDKDESGILTQIYEKIDFVDDKSVAACYLNPSVYEVKKMKHGDLIYPFGCNASQKQAVAAAFENQISVIQGPPGTGKTQTILNIIANVVRDGKTVMVVSNNNSATMNVLEKLQKYSLDFIVAALGSKENKELFIENQPTVPMEIASWAIDAEDEQKLKQDLRVLQDSLDRVYALQNEQVGLRQEQQEVEMEWKHFCMDHDMKDDLQVQKRINSSLIIAQWLRYQARKEKKVLKFGAFLRKIIERIRLWWLKREFGLHSNFDKDNLEYLVKELQILYYKNRLREISERLESIENDLVAYDAKLLAGELAEKSMMLFKSGLNRAFGKTKRRVFCDAKELRKRSRDFMKAYPIVLSTTFSARSCLMSEKLYDYLIVDESSQISIETGVLALSCAKNAVIVGDTLQLANVVTEDDKRKLSSVMEQYHIAEGYDCAKNSFLKSICVVIKDVCQTMLREHYRCHPRIINFCNQKFYGGNLLIMTNNADEQDVLSAIKTVKGNHAAGQWNQREIDVVKNEVLPGMTGIDSIGIVTPYNRQVDAFRRQLPDIETATIHKYQGREKDVIIMSVVDNQITPFADDPNLLNVAVSRAKNKFVLVMTGNEQKQKGNLTDLVEYINYNNYTVTESKIASIFDYLYSNYTDKLMEFIKSNIRISEYASENLTYALINEVLSSDAAFSCLKVLCHIPIRQIIKDMSLMNEEEKVYASHYSTHVDFLIINRVTKLPVLAVETDGYTYHNDTTEQSKRDAKKDHIFEIYNIPLLRLSTKGSGERKRIIELLTQIAS